MKWSNKYIQENWESVGISLPKETTIKLKDVFLLCIPYKDCLLFDTGGEDLTSIFVKTDKQGNCYSIEKNGKKWEKIAKFIKI